MVLGVYIKTMFAYTDRLYNNFYLVFHVCNSIQKKKFCAKTGFLRFFVCLHSVFALGPSFLGNARIFPEHVEKLLHKFSNPVACAVGMTPC